MRFCSLFLWLALSHVAIAADLKPNVEVQVSGLESMLHGVVSPSKDQVKLISKSLARAPKLKVIESHPLDACGTLKIHAPSEPFAVLVQRGTCTFAQKVRNAQKAGAAAVLVGDQLSSLYEKNHTLKNSLGGVCLLHCEISSSWVKAPSDADIFSGLQASACAADSGCNSGMCGLTGETGEQGRKACCLPDNYQQMDLGNKTSDIKIPAVFLGASDATRLHAAISKGSTYVQLATNGTEFGWLISAALIWVLGCFVEILSTWNSARAEREMLEMLSAPAGAASSPKRNMGNEESLDMTIHTALCYLLTATVGLVGLFLLIQQDARYVVFFMIFVFSMATTSVVTLLGTYPLVHKFFPELDQKAFTIPYVCHVTQAWAAGFAISLSLVVLWVVERHSPYAWILQDTFAVFVCCQFVLALRMNSIKVSTVLLVSFMVYDIFMVFISPLVFKSSVMVSVAQAGTGTTRVSPTNPFECERIPTERMPMLFLLPRVGSNGEYAMLGLGDVLLPGLLLSFMARYDTLTQHDITAEGNCFGAIGRFLQRYPYWSVGVVGYCVGLFLAFLANTLGFTILDVKGQPALLYLVPCTLAPLSLFAVMRGDWQSMWDGPEVLKGSQPQAQERAPLV